MTPRVQLHWMAWQEGLAAALQVSLHNGRVKLLLNR